MKQQKNHSVLWVMLLYVVVASVWLMLTAYGGITRLQMLSGVGLLAASALPCSLLLRREQQRHHQHEAHLAAVLEHAADAIIVLDSARHIVRFNQAASALSGYRAADVIGKPFAMLLTSESAPCYQQHMHHRSTQPAAAATTTRFAGYARRSDGTTLPVEVAIGGMHPYTTITLRDTTRLHELEEALQSSEEHCRTLARHFPGGAVILFDHNLRYLVAEGTMLVPGMRPGTGDGGPIEGKTLYDVFAPGAVKVLEPRYRATLAGQESTFELPLRPNIYEVHMLPVRNERGDIFAGMIMTQVITRQKHDAQALRKANRALHTISECNQALVRATRESVLLNDICRIITDEGGYALAWVGFAQHDEAQSITPVAHSGYTREYIASLKISWGDNPRGQGPAGVAIRSGKPCVVRDIVNAPAFATWREAVARSGFKSVIALPLTSADVYGAETLLGALTIYATDLDAFDEQETALLLEMANDLSYGIMALRTRSEHQRAQEQLRWLASIVQSSDDAIIGKTPEGTITSWNAAAERIYGYTAQEAIGRSISLLSPNSATDEFAHILAAIKQGESLKNYDTVRQRKDGTLIDISLTCSPIRDTSGFIVGASTIARDITEQKRDLAALAWESSVNASLAELSQTLMQSTSVETISVEVLAHARRLTSSTFGYVGYIDPHTGYLVCPTMTRDIWESCQVPDKNIVFTAFGGLWGWVLDNRMALMTNTPSDDQRSSGIPAGHIPIERFVSVPALIGETLLGQIALANAGRDYTDQDVQLLERMAVLYALTIQHRQAEQDMQQYAERLRNLHDIDRSILAAQTPAAIGEAALRHMRSLLPCDWATLLNVVPETGEAVVLVSTIHGGIQTTAAASEQEQTSTINGSDPEVLRTAPNDTAMRYHENLQDLPEPSPLVTRLVAAGIRSYVCVPLLATGQVIGALHLGTQSPAAFTAHHLRIAQEVANQLAIAIQHSRLFEQVQCGHERMQMLSRQLLEAQENERRRIARELHDQIGQALTAIKIGMQTTERLSDEDARLTSLENCLHLVDQAMQQVRNLSLDLRPSMLDDLGLVAALRWYIDRQASLAGFTGEFAAHVEMQRLPAPLETVCFRVVQEALTNIIRHAQARRVAVVLEQHESMLHLLIRDDGVGFDVQAAEERALHGHSLGLLGMQERVLLANGQMQIVSTPYPGTQHGTEIAVSFPLVPAYQQET